jgi:uncharacterized protein (DUF2267 family)
MPLNFEKHAAKGNEFLNKLAARLGDEENHDSAGRVLRSVLRTMRNHLTIEESFQLMAQLPMALKAVYVDGWKPNQYHSRIKTLREFSEQVMLEDGVATWKDFSGVSDASDAIEAVIKTLADYVSAGELHDIVAVLPEELKGHFLRWAHTP